MWDFLERLFGGGFMPHGHCYLWTPAMVWTQVVSNTLIGLAYLSISVTLAALVRRVKLPFSWVYIAFGTFILACGLTHFLDVATVWHPIYWADAGVRVLTAVASLVTAVLLIPLFPKVTAFVHQTRLEQAANEKLRVSEVRLRLLIDAVKDYAIFVLDPKGIVTSWNAGAERLKGYKSGEIIGSHFSKFYPEEDISDGKCERELDTATRTGRFEEEGWRVRADGSRFWANVVITPIKDSAGTLIGFAKVSRDLSERKAAQAERERLTSDNATLKERSRTQEFQERFIGILGHDLRNPLAAIQMGTALLRGSVAETDLRIVERVDSSTQRMARMIEQILELTRSRLGGGLKVNAAPEELCEIVTRVVDELRLAYPKREIALTCARPLQGSWDRDRLEQVFSNLVSNAIHHGSATAPVTVAVRDDGDALTITVHNQGPPIPEDLRTKLFDPFRRGSRDSRTAQTAGLGLGLFISSEIVAAHGGSLEVSSSAADGTTFRLTLPRTAVTHITEAGSA